MLTPQEVITAYRLILGRDPESQVIVENFVQYETFDSLRRILIGSGEFAERSGGSLDLLGLSPTMIMMNRDVRPSSRRLEHFVTLGLPVWGKTVLVIGRYAGATASFLADRFCKVSIGEYGEPLRMLKISIDALHDKKITKNVTFIDVDLTAEAIEPSLGMHNIVFADTPETDADGLRNFFDNTSKACADTMVMTSATAPGRSEDVFLTQRITQNGTTTLAAIPTRQWIMARLRERFEFAYTTTTQPSHEYFPLDWSRGWSANSATQQAVFVGSRTALNLEHLSEILPIKQTHCDDNTPSSLPLPRLAVRGP